MKPFSPLYFIKENRARCALLIFMIFLGSFASYIGGLYVSNVGANYDWELEDFRNMAFIGLQTSDPQGTEIGAAKDLAAQDEQLVVIEQMGMSNTLRTKTIMGFENSHSHITFSSAAAFKTFCQYMGISCDFDAVKNGSLIMSDRMAKNAGIHIGDSPDANEHDIERTFTFDATTDEEGYQAYFIDEDATVSGFLLINNGYSEAAFLDYTNRLSQDFNVTVYNYDYLDSLLSGQLASLYSIYTFIVVLLAVIMAVTINAGFVGLYQRRRYEFAVYRAIGRSRRQIIGKIAGELLCMDLIGLIAGGCAFFLGLYLFNNLVLYPVGKYLEYAHPLALSSLLLCNLLILIPLMFTRCKALLKADICEY